MFRVPSKMYREVVTVLSLLVGARGDCIKEMEDNNILTNRLPGNWTFNADLTKLMGADDGPTQELIGNMIISFSDEPEVLDDLPDDNCNFLEENDMKIYLAGTMRFFHIE